MLGERKSLALAEFAALEALRGARLLDLQYGDVEDERRGMEAREPGRLVRIPGTGHEPCLERPRELADTLLGFIQEAAR